MNLNEMVVDQEFRNLIPPLSEDEFKQLENNIIEDGIVHDPIIIWKGNDIIIDGHNRFFILQDHPDIPYSVYEKEFNNRDEVITWICQNQLGRRNITEIQRTILLGIAYEAKKRLENITPARGEHGYFLKSDEKEQARFTTAEQFGTTVTNVERSGRFVRGLNEIEKSFPGTIDRVKSGELEVTKKDVMKVASMEDGEQKKEAMQDIVDGKRIKNPLINCPIATVPEHTSEYDIKDFRSELNRKIDMLDRSLELTCVLTHKDILETDEGKEALRDTLLGLTEVIKKYFEMC